MKRILGLDLGTSSIGWAYILEAENDKEESCIKRLGVRVNPLSTDELSDFEKGRPITTNAGRTLARSARRNLQRYKLRRDNLIGILKREGWIDNATILAEDGNHSTFQTYELRAAAAEQQVTLKDFARILLMINKKRGYKSSRKVNKSEEGQLVDGMSIAKMLYDENLTPGQYVYQQLQEGKKKVPDFYRSDLQLELDRIWEFQQNHHQDILTQQLKEAIKGKGQRVTAQVFYAFYQFNTAENKGNRDEKRLQGYKWRTDALTKSLTAEEIAYVIADINGQLYNSSGYLGAISDRSKELYFNKQTVGQYLYKQLKNDSHARLKNQVFYRQDYLDEFERLWEVQSEFYPSLSPQLKEELRDIIIFYQRKLKSQKGLISFCEFEQREIQVNGKTKTVGLRVAPKSSPLFQEFKIWQQLHNVRLKNKVTKDVYELAEEQKIILFETLNLKENLDDKDVLQLIESKPKEWTLNYSQLEGNRTQAALYDAFLDILDIEGYDVRSELKLKLNKDHISISDLDKPVHEIKEMISRIFNHLNIDTAILDFDAQLANDGFEKQSSYQLWHLLYSYEEDNSKTGMDSLYQQLIDKFGFSLEQAKIMGSVALQDDYGNLSAKAMRRIYPYIQDVEYSEACKQAGYSHSSASLTREEILSRSLKDRLDILPKNSLRNPVVEKILNQMVHVVNALIVSENDELEKEGKKRDFRFDEIRIELARELKKNAKQREEMTKQINAAKTNHEQIVKMLQREDGISNPTRNDIIRYKLYQELKDNGYKDLYTNQYVARQDLFTNKYDIDHIIPQSRLFDDSFSNKTLCPRQINIEKGNRTAYDYIKDTFGVEGVEKFETRISNLHNTKDGAISKSKYHKLLKQGKDIGEGFIERDLRNTQYIAKKAKDMLFGITRVVTSTSGSITDRLREDWGLVNVMKELNLPKYRAAGMTEMIEVKGNKKEIISDWTKRNDHRHHAMDALTVAFTKISFIQYLNNLNARRDDNGGNSIANGKDSLSSDGLKLMSKDVLAIESKETKRVKDNLGNSKRVFNEPIANFRQIAKSRLEEVLVSHKAKNKVVTKNNNKIEGQKLPQVTLTPRAQLHKETVYGRIRRPVSAEVQVSGKFDAVTIAKVSNPQFRELLQKRLEQNDNDPKKAFTGKNALSKNPIYLDDEQTECIPDKVKLTWLEDQFTIRKQVTPELKIDKVIDDGVRRILQERLDQFAGDAKKAFSNLEQNPIWLNEAKGIAIKRVTISGVSNVEVLHNKKNHLGEELLDDLGMPIPVDFVSTGNNHHVAIYEDEKGNIQDKVISYFEAVVRVNQGLSIVDRGFNEHLGWKFLFTMKQNEMFLFPSEDFNPHEVNLLDRSNYSAISKNLFRVQKFSKVEYGNSAVRDYVFRHHLETVISDHKELRDTTYKIFKSIGDFNSFVKVRINHLGEIIHVGEY